MEPAAAVRPGTALGQPASGAARRGTARLRLLITAAVSRLRVAVVTSVAAMMLWEEGAFELSDPISRWLPEFAEPRVYMGGPATKPVTVPATEPIRVWHLLTHTSGLMTGGPGQQTAPAPARQRTDDDTLATYIPRLGAVALDYQPGTLWRYSGLAGFDEGLAEPFRAVPGSPGAVLAGGPPTAHGPHARAGLPYGGRSSRAAAPSTTPATMAAALLPSPLQAARAAER